MNNQFSSLGAFLLICFLHSSIAQASSNIDQNVFHAEVVKLYSFKPHLLSSKQIESKSADLDKFWKKVSTNRKIFLPLLRKELLTDKNSAYFFYDGSKLLLSISTEHKDRALALKSIPRADLNDLQHTDYLMTVHWFAVNGFDTTEAAMRILGYPEFKSFIVQHVLTLGQNYSLIYMLFPMEEDKFVRPLVAQLSREKNPVSQKSILLALWYSVTPEANKAIRNIIADASRPDEIRKYAKNLINRKTPNIDNSSIESISSIRDRRRKTMKRISDEALIEFDGLTAQLLVLSVH